MTHTAKRPVQLSVIREYVRAFGHVSSFVSFEADICVAIDLTETHCFHCCNSLQKSIERHIEEWKKGVLLEEMHLEIPQGFKCEKPLCSSFCLSREGTTFSSEHVSLLGIHCRSFRDEPAQNVCKCKHDIDHQDLLRNKRQKQRQL